MNSWCDDIISPKVCDHPILNLLEIPKRLNFYEIITNFVSVESCTISYYSEEQKVWFAMNVLIHLSVVYGG